jgi:predicted peptidase
MRASNRCSPGISLLILLLVASGRAAEPQTREHVVQRDLSTKLTYRCIVSIPAGYDAAPDRSWPMILWLHGGGAPKAEQLKRSIRWLAGLPAIIVAPICPTSPDGGLYTNWHWKMLGQVVREISSEYRVDPKMRSVIGFSMGGSGAWELPFYEPKLFSKVVVIAGVCHPWSLRHYPKISVWAFVGAEDYMRKEQQETITSAKRFGVDVVETVWPGADHGGIYARARSYQPLLNWLVSEEDLRVEGETSE